MATSWRTRPWPTRAAGEPVHISLTQQIDPEHRTPDADRRTPVNWISADLAPVLPDSLVGSQHLQLHVRGGPEDTEPTSGTFGQGTTPGWDQQQTRDAMTRVRSRDLGSVQARRFQPAPSRDGAYHVEVVPGTPLDGASPSTVALRHVTGVGAANDPHARTGQRIRRWRDRWIDRHMFGVEQRPVYLRHAYADHERPSAGGQYAGPFPTGGWFGRHGIGSPDHFVAPMERRVPRPWDESQTTDGTPAPVDFGLTPWGL
jgi:hypothetical protein